MENNQLILKDQKQLTLTGVVSVDGMTDKQVEISLAQTKLVVKGDGITVSKLDVDNGNLVLTSEVIYSLTYTKGKAKPSLAKLFK